MPDEPKNPPPPMLNKPNESPFLLKLEPANHVFFREDRTVNGLVTAEIRLTNTTDKRHTFKMKCTNNEAFRVRPALGFVEAGGSETIKVAFQVRTLPNLDRQYFALYHMPAAESGGKAARAYWTSTARAEGVKRLGVCFEKEDGSKWNVEAPK